jgi:hypothetical protein
MHRRRRRRCLKLTMQGAKWSWAGEVVARQGGVKREERR